MPTLSRSETTVLIPAAGTVPEGLLALSNIGSPAMIPVGGRPVIYWTLKYLSALGLKHFVVAVSRRGTFVEDFVECVFGASLNVQFIVPPADQGLAGTVNALAQASTTPSSLVVLGDTYFQFDQPSILEADEAFVLGHPVEASYRWCMAEADAQGKLLSLKDKVAGFEDQMDALIGVYFFPNTIELRKCTEAAMERASVQARPGQMADILQELMRRRNITLYRATNWLDCGNPDSQAESHRVLLQKRAFNELTIDATFGTITKRSAHRDKFVREIDYLRHLPEALQVLFPRVIQSAAEGEPFVTMEYYGYPTLSDMFLFENVDPGIWERLFLHLKIILTDGFWTHRQALAPHAVRSMYIDKTQSRLSQLGENDPIALLLRDKRDPIVNGKRLRRLESLWPLIESEIARWDASTQGTIIHGDFCFSNILYDLRSRITKFIDPRGDFGAPGLYGDPRYDVAKLYHSVYGLYDFLVNDLFHVSVAGEQLTLDIRTRPSHREILSHFDRVFFPEMDRREIVLVSGLLFASMIPLHYDHPKRQLAMYTQALQLLNEAMERTACVSA